MGRQLTAGSRQNLFDANSRKVMDIGPGTNYVQHLVTGVYFFLSDAGPEPHRPKAVVE